VPHRRYVFAKQHPHTSQASQEPQHHVGREVHLPSLQAPMRRVQRHRDAHPNRNSAGPLCRVRGPEEVNLIKTVQIHSHPTMDAVTLSAFGITDRVEQETVMGFYSMFVPYFPSVNVCMQRYFQGVVSTMKEKAEADSSVVKLTRCVGERDEKIQATTKKLSTMQQELISVKSELFNTTEAKGKLPQVERELNAANAIQAGLSNELEKAKGRISRVEKELNESNGKSLQLSAELKRREETMSQLQHDLKTAKGKMSQLLGELKKIKGENAKLEGELKSSNSRLLQVENISKKCQSMLHTADKLRKEADYTVQQYSECLTATANLTCEISSSVHGILNLMAGPLTSQLACCMEKQGNDARSKIPREFLDMSGLPITCPIVTRDGTVVSLRDVYTHWKDDAGTMKTIDDGAVVFAPMPQLFLFRSIANTLGICMQPPFKVQVCQDINNNWDDLPFMDQILIAFKVFKLCSRKQGTERALVMNESCFLVLNLHSDGLLKLSIDSGYSARMALIEPFDFGLPLHLCESGCGGVDG